MTVTLSVKNVPEALAEKLRARAAANHRSMQGELRSILDDALMPKRRLQLAEIWELGADLRSSSASESTQLVREMRDGRNRS
jgi:plasmid stability protein